MALILCECFHQDFEVENALLWDSQAGWELEYTRLVIASALDALQKLLVENALLKSWTW